MKYVNLYPALGMLIVMVSAAVMVTFICTVML